MAKGRSRANKPRHKGGKIIQPTPMDRDFSTLETVMRRRCAEFGLRPTVDNLKKVKAAIYGFELGKYRVRNVITEGEFSAGVTYALAYDDWRSVMGLPSRTPPAASYGLAVGGLTHSEDADDYIRRVKSIWSGWEAEAGMGGPAPLFAVNRVCIEDQPGHEKWLQAGLKILANYQKALTRPAG